MRSKKTVPVQSAGHSKTFEKFINFCNGLKAGTNASSLLSCKAEVEEKAERFEDAKRQFQQDIGPIPYIALILSWANDVDTLTQEGERRIACILDLIEQSIITLQHNKPPRLITLSELDLKDHSEILDAIRTVNDWSVDKQEDYVTIYVELANALSELTRGYIHPAYDRDRSVTANRRLGFDMYIKILQKLSERERILAKIFYFGGSRALEGVLSLKIQDIDFRNMTLQISDERIVYPKHVLHDLRYFIGKRTQGYVFTGRNGDKIDHTVPYRALKAAITKLNLDPSFTFKDFIRTI